MDYVPRLADRELEELLQIAGGVLVEGARGCGKTSTATRQAHSSAFLESDANALELASTVPAQLVAGERPRLIDEWQLAPRLFGNIRREIDLAGEPGQFILTESAFPPDDATRHTGAGRFLRMRMRPMSLVESGHSTGEVSLAALREGTAQPAAANSLTVPDVFDQLCRGGWPYAQRLSGDRALRFMAGYVSEIRNSDLPRSDGHHRDPERVGRLLHSLARNISTTASLATLRRDVRGRDLPLSDKTASEYLAALERILIVESIPAWAPQLRSRSRILGAPKRQVVDPAVAVAALGTSRDGLLTDLRTAGFLFESLVVRDLRIYSQSAYGSLWHYRDNTGLEVDCILEWPDGSWMALEVKLGTHSVDEAASTLLKFADRVDTTAVGEPCALCVVTATGHGYQRPDGVHVVPITTLGP